MFIINARNKILSHIVNKVRPPLTAVGHFILMIDNPALLALPPAALRRLPITVTVSQSLDMVSNDLISAINIYQYINDNSYIL